MFSFHSGLVISLTSEELLILKLQNTLENIKTTEVVDDQFDIGKRYKNIAIAANVENCFTILQQHNGYSNVV